MTPHDPLDRLEFAAEAVVRRADEARARTHYETGNRLGLLWVHGVVALLAGVQMILWGTAVQIETLVGPPARFVMGPLATVGGMLLIFGLTRRPRDVLLEGVGLSFIAVWDACMTFGLAFARWHQHDYHLLAPSEHLREGYVSAYPVAIYAGYLALLVVHLWTLRRMRVVHGDWRAS